MRNGWHATKEVGVGVLLAALLRATSQSLQFFSFATRALGITGRDLCYVCARLLTASTMYAKMATQIPFVVMYGIGHRASNKAIKAIKSEAMNHPFDGA